MDKFFLMVIGAWWVLVISEVLSNNYTLREEIKIFSMLFVIAYMGYATVDLLKKKS